MLVMNGAGRTGKIVDFIHFDIQWETDVMPDNFEIGVIQQIYNVAFCAGEKIVNADDFMAILEKMLAQMTSQKSGTPCNKHSFHICPELCPQATINHRGFNSEAQRLTQSPGFEEDFIGYSKARSFPRPAIETCTVFPIPGCVTVVRARCFGKYCRIRPLAFAYIKKVI
jgi:hypothetical protein